MMRRIRAAALAAVVLSGCETASVDRAGSATPVAAPNPPAARIESTKAIAPDPALSAAKTGPDAGATRAPQPKPIAAGEVGLTHECSGSVNHLARVQERLAAQDAQGALLEARRAAFDDPGNPAAFARVADLAGRLHDRALTRSALEAMAKASPADATALLKLARVLLREKDGAGALIAAAEAQRREPSSADAQHLSGRANLMLHRLDDAILDFVTATRLDPTHGFAFNNLGLCYLLAAKPERAVAPLEKAATLLPEVAFVHNNLGIAYERSDQKAEAREEYSKALELDPSYVKAAVNKARLSALAAADEIAVDPSSSAEDAASDVLATPASEDESKPQGAAGAPAGPGETP